LNGVLEVIVRGLLTAVLAAAVVLKLQAPRSAAAALGTFGFEAERSQWAAFGLLVAVESALAVGVAAGSDGAAYAAALLMLMFAATLGSALMRGRAGAPCACFGSRSTVSGAAIARNLALAAAFAALPSIPKTEMSTDEWLALGLGVALLACLALTVALFALAREIGMLRLRLAPAAALEISHEGPEVGGSTGLIDRFPIEPRNEFALAVFTSVGCHVCRVLGPAVDSLWAEPSLSVLTFEETADSDVWEALGIPGVPYAIAMDTAGTVLAKGTFNNLAQLESVIATAERRQTERIRIEALGV
jgi:hypothetical protein